MPRATSSVAAVNGDTVFVSHASPEDNAFALWLTLRLGEMGFKVWCDLTKLIGGETFWDNAEDAIRNSTAKFPSVRIRPPRPLFEVRRSHIGHRRIQP
jgi:TIR domain-containing protein